MTQLTFDKSLVAVVGIAIVWSIVFGVIYFLNLPIFDPLELAWYLFYAVALLGVAATAAVIRSTIFQN